MQQAGTLWQDLPVEVSRRLEDKGLGLSALPCWAHLWDDEPELDEFVQEACRVAMQIWAMSRTCS